MTLTFLGVGFSENKIIAQENKTKTIPVNMSISDERFTLKNVSFFKRLEKTASTLNISAEFHNNTGQDIKLKIILVAFRQIDSSNRELRKFIKYPSWRKRDLDKEQHKNILLDSLPRIDKNEVDASLKDPNVFPDFQKYLQYIGNNPSMGNDIVIKGINTGAAETSGNQDIYAVNQSMKTSVFAKLKVEFNPNNEFFNYFGIIVIDPDQKKIVGSELYYFDAPFRTH